MEFQQVEGLRVEIDDISFMPSLQTSPAKPYPFIYFLTICNDSDQEIQILGRKWIVEEFEYEICVLEGDGVVGEIPILQPGEKFSYNSYHVIAHTALVNGSFYGILTDSKTPVSIDVPGFMLEKP